jgi:AcrR family transcriptional regulator
MDRLAERTEARPYRSALREEQASHTRERILEAVVRVMARGLAELSIPAVAREAGVSIPTVYRHFSTKAVLLEAVHPYFMSKMGFDRMPSQVSLDELEGTLRMGFHGIEQLGDLTHAALMSPVGEQARRAQMPARARAMRVAADGLAPDLPPATRARLGRLLLLLTTTSSFRTLHEHLGLSTDGAAADVAWLIRAAVAGAPLVDR